MAVARMRGRAHLGGAFAQPSKILDPVAVDVLALGLGTRRHVAEARAAWRGLGVSVVLGGGFCRGLVELAHMAVALRILPQHHDAVVVDTTPSRLGGAVLVAQPQHHAILRGHRIVRRGVAALGHDAAIHVVLLGLAQARSLRGVGHARWARRVAQAIQHRVDRGRVGGGYATAPSQRLKLGGTPRRDVAIQRFLHHRTLAVVQGLQAAAAPRASFCRNRATTSSAAALISISGMIFP